MEEKSKNSQYKKEYYSESARRERFLRIAERRTNKILDGLRMLGNTSNKSLYLYSDSDIEKIFATIELRLSDIRAKFRSGRKEEKFKL